MWDEIEIFMKTLSVAFLLLVAMLSFVLVIAFYG